MSIDRLTFFILVDSFSYVTNSVRASNRLTLYIYISVSAIADSKFCSYRCSITRDVSMEQFVSYVDGNI